MAQLGDIANLRPRVEAVRFLELLQKIALRTELGDTSSLSISECSKWGFPPEQVLPYLLVLVEAGILQQKVQIYDREEDAFEDCVAFEGLDKVDPAQLKLLFRPVVSKEEFSHFFA